ncbi:MAG: nucleotidyltransferase domain-containing protein [Leptolyngbyaceae cyanobacterium]
MNIDWQQCRDSFHQRAATQQAERKVLCQQAYDAAIAAILKVAPTYPKITQIYLFGSITQPQQFHHHSDIDIAVAGTDAATYFALWRDLEAACPNWAIDLREINQPCRFADIVRQTGVHVYEFSDRSAQSQHQC